VSGSLTNWRVYRSQLVETIAALEADLVEPVEPDRLDDLTAAYTRLETAWKAHESGEANYESARANLTRAAEALDNCEVVEGPTDAELTKSQLRAQAASEAAWQALHDTRAATGTRDAAKAALERLEAEQAASEETATRREYFLTREASLTELGKYLKANRDRYTSGFWAQLLSYATTLISEATSGSVTRLTRNAAGEFLYEEGGRELSVSGYASGMQRAIFSTAIKLSLAAAVGTPFRVMLFDEITAAAGDEVSLQFTSLLSAAGKQVICVTHRAADAAAADRVIELT
jgi:DNA repair ATPase RecN